MRRTEALTSRIIRVVLGGSGLSDFVSPSRQRASACSCRRCLVTSWRCPTWNGNEFLLPNGQRPGDPHAPLRGSSVSGGRLVVEIVVHEGGAASRCAGAARPGDEAAVSGPGRGYHLDRAAPHFVIVGDETALPAISQLLEWMPGAGRVDVRIEIAQYDAALPLRTNDSIAVTWHLQNADAAPGEALIAAVRSATIPDGARIWAAGEAAAMQQIRRHLFDERHAPRSAATVRGYWKHGRAGDPDPNGE